MPRRILHKGIRQENKNQEKQCLLWSCLYKFRLNHLWQLKTWSLIIKLNIKRQKVFCNISNVQKNCILLQNYAQRFTTLSNFLPSVTFAFSCYNTILKIPLTVTQCFFALFLLCFQNFDIKILFEKITSLFSVPGRNFDFVLQNIKRFCLFLRSKTVHPLAEEAVS